MSDTENQAPDEEPKPKPKKASKKKEAPGRKPASESTIETGSEPDEVKVQEGDRERVLEDTTIEHEPIPELEAELERIREEEDEARERQEASYAEDVALKQAIDQGKNERDQAAKLAFSDPPGLKVDERHEVEFGNCLACGKPVFADEGYMRFAGGITHMHECATAYHNAIRDQVAKDRDISHDPNEVRHPNVFERVEGEPSGGQNAEPLNVAQGTTAFAGQGALANGAGGDDAAQVTIVNPTVEEFDTPVQDAVREQQEFTEAKAKELQESGEYVKN